MSIQINKNILFFYSLTVFRYNFTENIQLTKRGGDGMRSNDFIQFRMACIKCDLFIET